MRLPIVTLLLALLVTLVSGDGIADGDAGDVRISFSSLSSDEEDGIGDGDAGNVRFSHSSDEEDGIGAPDHVRGTPPSREEDGIGDGDAGNVRVVIGEGNAGGYQEAIVQGIVWAKGGASRKNVKVKLFRRDPVKALATTRTAADGTYKFIVEAASDFMEGKFYIRVLLPDGHEFITSKKRRSNVNRTTGRSGSFRIKPGEPVIRNAYIKLPPPQTRLMKGIVFEDLDGNGKQDGDEPSIPNFDLEIPTDTSGNFVTATTDNNGQYEVTVPILSTRLPREPSPVTPRPTVPNPQHGGTIVDVTESPLPMKCSIQLCVWVYENPNGIPCPHGLTGFQGVDVKFTVCYGPSPRPCSTFILTTGSNGRICAVFPANDLFTGPDATKVTVDIVDGTIPTKMPPWFQNYGSDSTDYYLNGCVGSQFTVWDMNGFA